MSRRLEHVVGHVTPWPLEGYVNVLSDGLALIHLRIFQWGGSRQNLLKGLGNWVF